MASIVDAFEESLQDNHAIFKIVLYTIPLYYCIHLLMEKASSGYFVFVTVMTSILLLGFALKCSQNVRSGQNSVLPSFNVFGVFFEGLKGTVALLPMLIISLVVEHFASEMLANYFSDTLLNVFIWIITGLCASLVYTAYILYAKRFKITDAYNFGLISKYCVDILLAVIFMKIKLILADLLLLLPVTYVIWLFFGIPHPVAIFFWCLISVFSIAMIGHYLSQVGYEIIEVAENDD